MNEDRCVVCGKPVPEGRMICLNCDDKEPNFNTTKIKISLDKIADVKEFVGLVSKCSDDVTVGVGRFAVDAKSIMGIFSIDLTKPLNVEFYGDIPYEVEEGMKKFIIN